MYKHLVHAIDLTVFNIYFSSSLFVADKSESRIGMETMLTRI